jgi:hypothetical protein
LRSAYDREIVRLAVPALGALAAEPLYLLADTAIIGNLGTPELAALALAAALLSTLVSLCIFLTYATTAQVARLHGAGEDARAGALAAQALWLSLAIGLALTVLLVACAAPAIALLGGEGRVANLAERYVRISAVGVPFALVALAGQGYLRGVSDLRRPLVVLVVANAVNVVLDVLFVYGFGWGSTAPASARDRAGGDGRRVRRLPAARRGRRPPPSWARSGRSCGWAATSSSARRAAGLVPGAGAVLARIGAPSLGRPPDRLPAVRLPRARARRDRHRRPGARRAMLGAGDAGEAAAAARRMLTLALSRASSSAAADGRGRRAARLFTDDPAVIERARRSGRCSRSCSRPPRSSSPSTASSSAPGDTRYLAVSMVVAGLRRLRPGRARRAGVRLGHRRRVVRACLGLMAVRLITLGARFRGRRWAITGA